MRHAFARSAAPMLALFRMVGITPRQRASMSVSERKAVARRIRREANAYGIPRLRLTRRAGVVACRRAKNRVARRTRRINRCRA